MTYIFNFLIYFSVSFNLTFKAKLIIKGNHECRQLTRSHNFWSDCIIQYDQEIYDLMMETFDYLPICAIINGKFLAVHGGLSPDVLDVKSSFIFTNFL